MTSTRLDTATTVTPQEVVFRPAGLLQPSSRFLYEANPKQRLRPVFVINHRLRERRVQVSFPATWRLARLPPARRVANRFGTMTLSYDASTPGALRIVHRLELRACQQPASTIAELVALLGGKGKGEVPPLVFTRPTGPT